MEEDADGWLRMNIEKGNQSTEGRQMVNLGNLGHPEIEGNEYKIKTLTNQTNPVELITDADGQAWLIVGTDSGFEGLTKIYFSSIGYLFELAE